VPVDPESLATLGELASRPGADPSAGQRRAPEPPGPRDPLALLQAIDPATRQRVLALGAGSVLAGLVCGLLVPATAEAQPGSAPRSAGSASPASLTLVTRSAAAVSPFSRFGPARPTGSTPSSGPASTGPVSAARVLVIALGDAGPAAPHPRATLPAVKPAWRVTRALPAGSGTGRRIVYAERAAHLWVVAADGTVLRDYKVTGRIDRPRAGTYRVWSKSEHTSNPKERLRFDLMVRFARGYTGAPIGFHTIPRTYAGVPIQSESQLGSAVGQGGCVRQSRVDAEWLYSWVHVGDTVVVLR
jgi:lipoprotein-anchoring transpeptidase ErfK/SrfK